MCPVSCLIIFNLFLTSALMWHFLDLCSFFSFSFSLYSFFFTLVYLWLNSVDCLDPTCSNNGICVNGECHCKPGWGGLHCELPRAQCPDQCHGHGAFIPDTGLCSCDPNWMGPDCSMGRYSCRSGPAERVIGVKMEFGLRIGNGAADFPLSLHILWSPRMCG